MIPTIISDNFFPEPDQIVDFALQQEFFSTDDGNWPGKRTKHLWEINIELFKFVAFKILKIASFQNPRHWYFDMQFQLIEPFNKIQNNGWIHQDDIPFGGIVFLNKNPEENTGTSIYKEKFGYSLQTEEHMNIKRKFYLNEKISDDEYLKTFDQVHSQYEETISIKNVYNRLCMFSGNTYHGAQTYGINQPRLTLAFFCKEITTDKSII